MYDWYWKRAASRDTDTDSHRVGHKTVQKVHTWLGQSAVTFLWAIIWNSEWTIDNLLKYVDISCKAPCAYHCRWDMDLVIEMTAIDYYYYQYYYYYYQYYYSLDLSLFGMFIIIHIIFELASLSPRLFYFHWFVQVILTWAVVSKLTESR